MTTPAERERLAADAVFRQERKAREKFRQDDIDTLARLGFVAVDMQSGDHLHSFVRRQPLLRSVTTYLENAVMGPLVFSGHGGKSLSRSSHEALERTWQRVLIEMLSYFHSYGFCCVTSVPDDDLGARPVVMPMHLLTVYMRRNLDGVREYFVVRRSPDQRQASKPTARERELDRMLRLHHTIWGDYIFESNPHAPLTNVAVYADDPPDWDGRLTSRASAVYEPWMRIEVLRGCAEAAAKYLAAPPMVLRRSEEDLGEVAVDVPGAAQRRRDALNARRARARAGRVTDLANSEFGGDARPVLDLDLLAGSAATRDMRGDPSTGRSRVVELDSGQEVAPVQLAQQPGDIVAQLAHFEEETMAVFGLPRGVVAATGQSGGSLNSASHANSPAAHVYGQTVSRYRRMLSQQATDVFARFMQPRLEARARDLCLNNEHLRPTGGKFSVRLCGVMPLETAQSLVSEGVLAKDNYADMLERMMDLPAGTLERGESRLPTETRAQIAVQHAAHKDAMAMERLRANLAPTPAEGGAAAPAAKRRKTRDE